MLLLGRGVVRTEFSLHAMKFNSVLKVPVIQGCGRDPEGTMVAVSCGVRKDGNVLNARPPSQAGSAFIPCLELVGAG